MSIRLDAKKKKNHMDIHKFETIYQFDRMCCPLHKLERINLQHFIDKDYANAFCCYLVLR